MTSYVCRGLAVRSVRVVVVCAILQLYHGLTIFQGVSVGLCLVQVMGGVTVYVARVVVLSFSQYVCPLGRP